jgi:hypothetical protein
MEISGPDSKHEFPQSDVWAVWVNDGGFASRPHSGPFF